METPQKSRRWFVAAAMMVVIGFGAVVQAAGPNSTTAIATKKMCPVCAKKIVAKLQQVDGVAKAQADVQSKTFVVVPASGRVLSPRALWETVEKNGEQPVRLAGPSGTFNEKPRF